MGVGTLGVIDPEIIIWAVGAHVNNFSAFRFTNAFPCGGARPEDNFRVSAMASIPSRSARILEGIPSSADPVSPIS